MKLVVGIAGASGAPYAKRLLDFLAGPGRSAGIDTHIIFTKFGKLNWVDEVGTDPADYGFPIYNPGDMAAPMASGSARFDALVVIPASAGQLARITHGVSADLVGRTADVMLKEGRTVLLVLRESPYSLVHVRNMKLFLEAGGRLMPASPSFYSGPDSIEALLDTVVARVLDQLGIDNALMKRWAGRLPKEERFSQRAPLPRSSEAT